MAAHFAWRGLVLTAMGLLCAFVPQHAVACPIKLSVTPAFMGALAPNNDITAQTMLLQVKVGCALKITQQSPAQAIQAVLDGDANAAGVWSEPKNSIRNLTGDNIFDLKSTRVGSQTLHGMVNTQNPIRGLSEGHIRGILTGELKDWAGLTGHSAAIIVIEGDKTGEVQTLLQKTYLNGFAPAYNGRVVSSASHAVRALEQTDNALGFFSGALPQGNIAALAITPPVLQNLYIVTSGKPDADMKKLIDALQARGLE